MKKTLTLIIVISLSFTLNAQNNKEENSTISIDLNINNAYNEIGGITEYLKSSSKIYTDAFDRYGKTSIVKLKNALKPIIGEYKTMANFSREAEKHLQLAINDANKFDCDDKEMAIIRSSGHMRKFISTINLAEDRMYVALNSNNNNMTLEYIEKSNESLIKSTKNLKNFIAADGATSKIKCIKK